MDDNSPKRIERQREKMAKREIVLKTGEMMTITSLASTHTHTCTFYLTQKLFHVTQGNLYKVFFPSLFLLRNNK